MKSTKLFIAALAVTAAFTVGCSDKNNGNDGNTDAGEAVMRITLAGSESRAVVGTLPEENKVNKFTVYVFNDENDVLEAVETVSNGSTSATISGLSTGFSKKVMVIANAPDTFPTFIVGDQYSKFMQAAGAINLTYQSPANAAADGLVMMGQTENAIDLNPTGITQVEISLKRLVAKVQLGTVKVVPEGHNQLDLFEITGVSIQRAVASTDIFGNALDSAPTSMFCGILGSYNSIVKDFLYDTYAPSPEMSVGVEKNFGNYFYVLPNQDPDNCTLLTLVTTYDGDEQYFPIKINSTVDNGNTDGTYITSNRTYTVNIVVNNLSEGTEDPDLPPTTASMEVKVMVEDWELDIIQNVIW